MFWGRSREVWQDRKTLRPYTLGIAVKTTNALSIGFVAVQQGQRPGSPGAQQQQKQPGTQTLRIINSPSKRCWKLCTHKPYAHAGSVKFSNSSTAGEATKKYSPCIVRSTPRSATSAAGSLQPPHCCCASLPRPCWLLQICMFVGSPAPPRRSRAGPCTLASSCI